MSLDISLQKLVYNPDFANVQQYAHSPGYCRETLEKYHHKRTGDTIVIFAVRKGELSLLQWLAGQGFNLEIQNFDGKRPLHEAAQTENLDILRFLLGHGVSVDPLKRGDWTPLMLACTKTKPEVIRCLLDAGANPSLVNKDGWNSFHVACREGHIRILEELLKNSPDQWQNVSFNGRTPLHTAAFHGHTDVVEKLLDLGHQVDPVDRCGSSPLMDGFRAGCLPVAELLISKGANVSQHDDLDRQCIHVAAEAGVVLALEYLVNIHNVPINVQTQNGVTPLHLAAKENRIGAIEFLLRNSADGNLQDTKGRTALHLASGARHIECVKLLLDYGVTDCADLSGCYAKDYSQHKTIFSLLDAVQQH